GHSPSEFPFYRSIVEYWTLYDRVIAIARESQYPENGEYLTMLRVIGVSTTAEYLVKGAYEGTIGRLMRWSANNEDTEEDRIYARAQQAYAHFIHDKAWYESTSPAGSARCGRIRPSLVITGCENSSGGFSSHWSSVSRQATPG